MVAGAWAGEEGIPYPQHNVCSVRGGGGGRNGIPDVGVGGTWFVIVVPVCGLNHPHLHSLSVMFAQTAGL